VSAMLEAALHYRSLGFSVLPLAGKTPHARLLQRTHGTVSTKRVVELGSTEEQVHVWFSEPGVNVGVFCGEPSGGLVVVDVDGGEFPLPGSRLPLTPLVKTGREQHRGHHLYYRSTADISTRPFQWGEIRGRPPSYVVAPPSIHPATGRPYAWQLPLEEAPLADFSLVRLPQQPPASASAKKRPNTSYWGCPTGDTPSYWGQGQGQLAPFVRHRPRPRRRDGPRAGDHRATGNRLPVRPPSRRQPLRSPPPNGQYRGVALPRLPRGAPWCPQWLSLAQVRATLAGRVGKLLPSEHATWKLILLVEAGLLPLIPVRASQLPVADALLAQVYERFLFLLGCRWNYQYGAPAPFTRDFAAALCETTVREARDAIDRLKDLGAIYVAQEQPRGIKKLRLWLPDGVEPDTCNSDLEQEPV
jgi:Bifunctional DNA primase/polymerase, N-terminal